LSFESLSGLGGSVLYTEDAELQVALEGHPRFGELFYAEEVEEAVEETPAMTAKDSGVLEVEVSDLGMAKNYLAETFGLARTSLRSKQSIVDAGKAHGVEFVGLE
jgi:hypothetical protein